MTGASGARHLKAVRSANRIRADEGDLMVQPVYLHGLVAENTHTAEAMMIGALVDSGDFLPARWGVSIDDVEIWAKVWSFCEGYQRLENKAPSWSLIHSRFPEFPPSANVGCAYAATQLGRDAESRRLRTAIKRATTELGVGDIEAAKSALSEVGTHRPMGKPGQSIWEPSTEVDSEPRCPTPYPTLDRATGGGIGPSELWYLAGLAGHGKTMILCKYVAELITAGQSVSYLSLEVPTAVINKRVRRALATPSELKLLDAVDSQGFPDIDKINQAIATQRDRITGELFVYDSTHGRVNPSTVRYHCASNKFTVVDHIGLMYTPDGKRAVDDWRLYATISNCLLEEKNASGTTILAAAQLNRGADVHGRRAPAVNTVGGAYQLVQDADVLVTMKRQGKKAMVHAARKVREGQELTWYSNFDVAKARFGEIPADTAADLEAQFPFDDA